jgi:hypothetical protein
MFAAEGPCREIDKLVMDLSARWVPAGSAKKEGCDIMQIAVREVKLLSISCPQTAYQIVMGMLYPQEHRPFLQALLSPMYRPLGYVPIKKSDFCKPLNYRDIIDHQYTHITPIAWKKDKVINGVELV